MKNTMTIEHALALVTDYASTQYNPPTVGNSDELRQAADILRNMAEAPVGKGEFVEIWTCGKCHEMGGDCTCLNPSPDEWCLKIYDKTWIEARVLKIVEHNTDVNIREI